MSRKKRFWAGFLFLALTFSFPLASAIILQTIWAVILVLTGFLGSVYLLYRFTIRKVKPKYPAVPPTGKPDIYTALRIPRPIYEDMEQYPWLFKKRNKKRTKTNKMREREHKRRS